MMYRPAIALALSAVALGLAACSSTPDAAPSPSASSSPSSSPVVVAGGLSFELGNELPQDIESAPAFLNGFAESNSGWTEAEDTDSENGLWTYTSNDGLCTSKLSQVIADGDSFDIVAGDDRATSTNVLAWYYRDSPDLAAQIESTATDATLPFGADWQIGEPGTDFRGVSAENPDGAAFAAYARGFGVPGVALIAEITCETGLAFAQHAQDALMNSAVAIN
jgi:hypothetical protein